jgi:4-amino-4-deoxy-L-arabinose transferase-like glycosyltransferase
MIDQDPCGIIAPVRTSARDYLILIAVCVLLFAPPILYRELSGVELRTALFTRNILTCGPSFIPRLYDSPYFDYPPLYFLLSALFSKITGGINNFSLALPDILGAIGTLILVFLFADRLNRGSRIIAGLALLTTPLFFILATEPIVDMLLTFFITSTLISYFIYLSNRKTYLLLLSWAGFAGGALTKGPVGVIVPLSVILVYLAATRQWEELAGSFLKLGVGLALLACICALCVILSDGRTALKELIDAQLLDRITDEPNRSPAFYLVVFLVGFHSHFLQDLVDNCVLYLYPCEH